MSYYEFASDSGTGYGSLETFFYYDVPPATQHRIGDRGWYWWPCFPGCHPDGDPVGPFQTERDAVIDAGGIWDDLSETTCPRLTGQSDDLDTRGNQSPA